MKDDQSEKYYSCISSENSVDDHTQCMFKDQVLRGDDLRRARLQVKMNKPLRNLSITDVSTICKYCCCCLTGKKNMIYKDTDHVEE